MLISLMSPPQEAKIGYPTLPETNVYGSTVKIFPSECRQKGTTYRAKLSLTLRWRVGNDLEKVVTKAVGQIPVMVKVNFFADALTCDGHVMVT